MRTLLALALALVASPASAVLSITPQFGDHWFHLMYSSPDLYRANVHEFLPNGSTRGYGSWPTQWWITITDPIVAIRVERAPLAVHDISQEIAAGKRSMLLTLVSFETPDPVRYYHTIQTWDYGGERTVQITTVPEPAALALLLPMLGMLRRRRMRSNRSAMTAP